MKLSKKLLLKLGSACNLNCRHCHAEAAVYQFNDDILDYIRANNFSRITFSGGEPLLYLDIIKKVVEAMPDGMHYKLVTNGTLLMPEIAKYLDDHNFHVFFSYDGENDSRKSNYPQCWQELKKIKKHGLATLFSEDNCDSGKLFSEIQEIRRKFGLNGQGASAWANFLHQTGKNTDEVSRELAKQYCLFIAGQLELDFRKLKAVPSRRDIGVLTSAFWHWIFRREGRGCKCFNEEFHVLAANGDFLLCPYIGIKVGDIYSGIDWGAIELHIPERCRGCSQWKSCMNTCIMNRTDNECYISKVMYNHFNKLMNKYGMTYEELETEFTKQVPEVK